MLKLKKNIFFLFIQILSLKLNGATYNFKSGLEWINGVQVREVADSDLNPDNRIFKTPRGLAKTDIRGDFRLKYFSGVNFVFRPRFQGTSFDIYYPNSQESLNMNEGNWDINELFGEYFATDVVSFNFGLQNYQWGPAEVMSPSNSLFHFENDQKSIFYRAKGKVLLRTNLSFLKTHSLIFINEPISNNEPGWMAAQKFESKSIIKWEKRSLKDSNTYFGITLGNEEQNKKFVGTYFNYFFQEKYSIYADIKFKNGSDAYYPKQLFSDQYLLMQDSVKQQKQQTLAVLGFRVEARGDFRIEWVYNSAGYDDQEVSYLGRSLAMNQLFYYKNLELALKPGLELYTQNYLYLSYRLPDLGKKKLSTLFFRYITSINDKSGTLEMLWDSALNDFWNYYIEITSSHGENNTEFRLFEKGSLFLGVKFAI
ncbi:MAG: hypothetical protein L6Q37_04525 [Bdellovibrionaceae bacterium]|nr:hypothetical protein [Pseudobdellovibrionaceae bacterium]NUM59200.1 hypothetical protein [Pseudobdellovibrionaceae bacterium]